VLSCEGVNLYVPPFMNASGQFHKSDSLEARRIASPRIQIEKTMERIKTTIF